MNVFVKDALVIDLMDTTQSLSPDEAVQKAIKFTLMHDNESVRDALSGD